MVAVVVGVNTDPLLLLPVNDRSDGGDLIRRAWAESKKTWHIAVPSMFTRVAMFSITVVTQAFAGHLSDLDLAAITIVTTVIIGITFGFLLGMASALETLCGQAYGAKQYHMLGIYMQRSWVVLFVCSIFMLPLYIFATPILKLTGQSAVVADQAGLVALWLIPLHFSFGFQFSLVRFLQCQLKMTFIALVSGVVLAIHVMVSWLFVYKLRVGMVGTAITIGFSWWISTLGLFGFVAFGGCPNSWTGFSKQAFSGLWEFFRLSLASGVMLSLENFYYRVLIIVSGNMTNAEVALNALSVWLDLSPSSLCFLFQVVFKVFISRYSFILFDSITIFVWESMIFLGFFAAAGVRVSNELGAGNSEGAKFASIVSVCSALLVGLLSWIMIAAFPDKLAMIFSSNTSVIKMVKELSMLLACTVLLNSIQPVLSGVAVGSGWQSWVAFINIGSYYIVGVPLGVLLGWLFDLEIKAIWTGMISGTVVQTVILGFISAKYDWQRLAQKARLHANQDATS